MADIKNFSLAGVGSSVQFGKRGAQLQQASDAFAFRNAANNAFALVKVAYPTLPDHATTKAYVDAQLADINSARIQDSTTATTAYVGTAESGDAGKVVVGASNGTATSVVATFQSGASANASIVFDNATADTVVFAATGTSDNIDVRISPKGDGAVDIGLPGTSAKIEVDDSQSLTVGGGDSAAGVGGTLFLQGGNGATGQGDVQITDGLQDPIAIFTPATSATSHAVITNGTTSVSFAAAGTLANVDVNLAPKGTGVVNVGTHLVSNVVDPVSAQDAATKAYTDALSTSSKVGSIQTRQMTIGTTNSNLGSPITGRIRRIMINITQAYTGGATINIGNSTTANAYIDSSQIDESTVGVYELSSVDATVVNMQLIATVAGSFGFTGAATLVVEYVQA